MKNTVLTPVRSASLEQLSPGDSDILLGNARLLQSAAEPRETKTLLRGKKLALLCESEDGADAILFRAAASELGAHVSHIRPHLSDLRQPDDLQHTARMLGRLYDGIECQGLAQGLVEMIGREAGVPVYDGLASERHPTARLAGLLGDEDIARQAALARPADGPAEHSGMNPASASSARASAPSAAAAGAGERRRTAMHPTLRVIRDEHGVLSAVLRSISLLLSESRRLGFQPDFTTLRAMLFYIDEFPEKVHHTKESELLFPKLRERSGEAAAVLDRLDADHASSHRAVRDLEHELLALEMMSEAADAASRRERFEAAVQAYVMAYLEHMRLEETEVLPLAERVLSASDWAELDAAFMKNRDPLTHREGDDAFRPLFKRILMTLPAPLGLGPAMEALGDSYKRV